ncbi:thiol-disulfide oxidoreductase DCC family protein [Pyxidicoccus parkwayensis]|uniref:Thiol-disulfide oxidoreductase DCC family protein n=1 Tax=Pyxidicoccus parkwayensis TaxID=2813578 RepID=A0ABX7NIL6_9BACT|nr:thiol-disulfide oxidoreductase DCC family protein [Pyxidicoccus parkwaysis]QSQ18702.1 thiol-disulfide oxidoreductase DCC family protein [Pyxidicoccus parkwaysis]
MSEAKQDTAVVLFDGVCNLCNGAVNFIIDRDPSSHFRFAALQSAQATALLAPLGRVPEAEPQSFILVEDGRVYERSSAALRVARKLPGAWKLFYAFIVVPRPIRDVVYRFIARNRYRWFGKAEACRMPTPELRARFL